MAKADTENLLLHVVKFLTKGTKLNDPIGLTESVMEASTDNESIVLIKIFLLRKLAVDHSEEIP